MRIISGQWRGHKLVAPLGARTRPTADRTRETLFSMLTSRLGSFEGMAVADLFAGSGALGLEALSRGAATCVFAEQDPAALRALRHNIAALRAHQVCEVRGVSVMALGPAKHSLDLILMDPPYDTNAGAVALDKLARLGWVNPQSWIAIETSSKEDASIKGFEPEAVRDVGKARITLLRPA